MTEAAASIGRCERRAAEYRLRSASSADASAGSPLAGVRDAHARAAARWAALADAEDARVADYRRRRDSLVAV